MTLRLAGLDTPWQWRARSHALLLLEPVVAGLGPNVYNIMHRYTRHGMRAMLTNIEIDDVLMREAQKASGHATKKQTVEEALRLMISGGNMKSTPPSADSAGVAT